MTPIGEEIWDAVIVGAGVAGGCAAALLAERGWRVLLVEKSDWPRETVCGGCLSASSVAMLQAIGLGGALRHAVSTDRVLWQQGSRHFEHAIPRGAMLTRIDLDAAIVQLAIDRGVTFRSGCNATIVPMQQSPRCTSGAPIQRSQFDRPDAPQRTVHVRTDGQTIAMKAGVVIAADGLGGTLVKDEPWAGWTISRSALMGVASTIMTDWAEIEPGRIHMCLSKWGYVGIARADQSTVHVAAALRPNACKQIGGPRETIAKILSQCGRSVPAQLFESKLLGTGKLTRYRRQLGGHRVLTLGDACGYVEPVTGEGMAWAIRGAMEINQLLPDSSEAWPDDLPQQWQRRHWRSIGRTQRWCRWLRSTVRHPISTAAALRLASTFPGAARKLAHLVCSPSQKDLSHDPSGHTADSKYPQLNLPGDPGHRHRQPAGSTANAGV